MGNKLLIVASKGYGNYVKEIAESMGCFDEISFVDNDRLDAIGKLEEIDKFSSEYGYAIAACDEVPKDWSGIRDLKRPSTFPS